MILHLGLIFVNKYLMFIVKFLLIKIIHHFNDTSTTRTVLIFLDFCCYKDMGYLFCKDIAKKAP